MRRKSRIGNVKNAIPLEAGIAPILHLGAHLLNKGPRDRGFLVRHTDEAYVWELLLQCTDVRDGIAAGRAPRGPHFDHTCMFSFQLAQFYRIALHLMANTQRQRSDRSNKLAPSRKLPGSDKEPHLDELAIGELK